MVQLNQLPGVALLFGIIVVFGIVMGTLVDTLKDDECASFDPSSGNCADTGANVSTTAAYNFSNFGANGLINIAGKMGLLGTIIILAAVIGVVIGVFRFRGGGF